MRLEALYKCYMPLPLSQISHKILCKSDSRDVQIYTEDEVHHIQHYDFTKHTRETNQQLYAIALHMPYANNKQQDVEKHNTD